MAKLLVVDDSKMYSRMIKRELDKVHETVVIANSGSDALDRYKEVAPNVVVLDVTMPEMSGKECLIELKKIDPTAKIIMLTAIQNQEMREKCLELGASRFLNKAEINAGQGINILIDAIAEVAV